MALYSNKPEFIVVYGRRRIGKTYLIREYFNNKFSFYTSGTEDKSSKYQLSVFASKLSKYSGEDIINLKSWLEAFTILEKYIEEGKIKKDETSKKYVLFFDEIP